MKEQKNKRGFATLSPEKRREIAAKGGRSVPPEKRSFALDKTLAQRAGFKGGSSVAAEKRSFSKDPAQAARAGRKGGFAKGNAN
jgi:general stress protein YciG